MNPRRDVVAGLVLAAAGGLLNGCGKSDGHGGADRPNVILLIVDTLRADHIHGYGYDRETTPNLDRIIEEGARFNATIAPASFSFPSHATIVTGVEPYRHMVLDWGQAIAPDVGTLAAHLQRQGYETGLFSSHIGLHRGVERIVEGCERKVILKSTEDAEVLDAAATWASNRERPFFLYIALMTPHAPYEKYPPAYDGEFFRDMPEGGEKTFPFTEDVWIGSGGIPRSVRLGDEQELGFYVNRYDRSIRYVDELIGEFLATMEAAGLMDDTLLVVTSDHGEGLGEHGCFAHELYLYDFLVRVPLVFRFPGVIPAGQTWPRVNALADVTPTILGLLGHPAPWAMDGFDLSRGLREALPSDAERVIRSSYRARGFDRYMVRSDRHKLIFDAITGEEQMFDLESDPTESQDLLTSAEGRTTEPYSMLRVELNAHLARHAQIPPDRLSGSSVNLPPDVQAELRELGYLGGQ